MEWRVASSANVRVLTAGIRKYFDYNMQITPCTKEKRLLTTVLASDEHFGMH